MESKSKRESPLCFKTEKCNISKINQKSITAILKLNFHSNKHYSASYVKV